MAKLDYKLPVYTAMIDELLARHDITRDSITEGWQAWKVADMAGVTRDAYEISRDICDAHIQTVLEKILPNAVFKDAKRY